MSHERVGHQVGILLRTPAPLDPEQHLLVLAVHEERHVLAYRQPTVRGVVGLHHLRVDAVGLQQSLERWQLLTQKLRGVAAPADGNDHGEALERWLSFRPPDSVQDAPDQPLWPVCANQRGNFRFPGSGAFHDGKDRRLRVRSRASQPPDITYRNLIDSSETHAAHDLLEPVRPRADKLGRRRRPAVVANHHIHVGGVDRTRRQLGSVAIKVAKLARNLSLGLIYRWRRGCGCRHLGSNGGRASFAAGRATLADRNRAVRALVVKSWNVHGLHVWAVGAARAKDAERPAPALDQSRVARVHVLGLERGAGGAAVAHHHKRLVQCELRHSGLLICTVGNFCCALQPGHPRPEPHDASP